LRACRADILAVEAVMPRAKSQIGNRGGRRKGAGRKRELALSDRLKIASDYHARMQKIREGNTKASFSRRRRREDIIRGLMAKYGATHRMIVRCLDEFLGKTKHNEKMWKYATEGDGIQPLPTQEKKIKKLKPGIYTDEKLSLRLIVNSAGNRKWSFRIGPWSSPKSSVIVDKILGGSELSLATARELATKARRMVEAGRDP